MRIAVKVKELVVMGRVNANSSESEGIVYTNFWNIFYFTNVNL